MFGMSLITGRLQTDEPEAVEIDFSKIATEHANDSQVRKAEREVAKALAAVEAYNVQVGRVMRGDASWSDGGRTVVNRLPDELNTGYVKAMRKLEQARVNGFRRVVGPAVDPALEAARRGVLDTGRAFIAAMARLDDREKMVRSLRPHGAGYWCGTADLDLASGVALSLWQANTWPPKRADRPKPEVVNERDLVDSLLIVE